MKMMFGLVDCAQATRDTAGSAAAPAARCRNSLRCGSFIICSPPKDGTPETRLGQSYADVEGRPCRILAQSRRPPCPLTGLPGGLKRTRYAHREPFSA